MDYSVRRVMIYEGMKLFVAFIKPQVKGIETLRASFFKTFGRRCHFVNQSIEFVFFFFFWMNVKIGVIYL